MLLGINEQFYNFGVKIATETVEGKDVVYSNGVARISIEAVTMLDTGEL